MNNIITFALPKRNEWFRLQHFSMIKIRPLYIGMRRIIIVSILLSVSCFTYAQRAEIFRKKDKFGIREDKKTLVKPKYESLVQIGNELFAAETEGLFGVITINGTQVIPYTYDGIMPFDDNLFLAKKGTKWGLIDRFDNEILPAEYTGFRFVDDYLCEVKWNGKIGYINKHGRVVISPLYDAISPFSKEYFLIVQNNKKGLIDHTGKTIIPAEYDSFEKNESGFIIKKGNKTGLMDASGRVYLDAEYDRIEDSAIGKNLIKGDKIGFYTTTGKLIEPAFAKVLFYQPEFGLAVVETDNKKRGFVTSGGVCVEPVYDNISRFSAQGVAFVERNGKLMAVNYEGKEITVQQISQPNLPPPPGTR